GDTIWVSGQVGIDDAMMPANGMAAQARLAFEGLERKLRAAGAKLEDVVELTTYHIDLRGELEEFSKLKDEFFPRNYPAWTAAGRRTTRRLVLYQRHDKDVGHVPEEQHTRDGCHHGSLMRPDEGSFRSRAAATRVAPATARNRLKRQVRSGSTMA